MLVCLSPLGCSLVPKEQRQQQTIQESAKFAGTRNTEIEQHIQAAPTPTIVTTTNPKTGETSTSITPPPARVDTHYAGNAEASAGAATLNSYDFSESIPLFVKLIGLAIGLALLAGVVIGVWIYVRRASAAVAASAELADHILAEQIQRLRNKAMAAKDPDEITEHSTEIAGLEAQRGKLARRKR